MSQFNDTVKEILEEAGKCTGPTKKAHSDRKGKKSFKARHRCGSAKKGSPQAAACADWK